MKDKIYKIKSKLNNEKEFSKKILILKNIIIKKDNKPM